MKRLCDVGEFGLIGRIERLIEASGQPRVVLGPGDDAALVRPLPGHDLVVTTDSLVEDVHFRWRTQSPQLLGRRALVASLSDLAAMGATPLGCVVAFCAPASLELARALGIVRGILREAALHACPLVGGNVAKGRETSISITVFGTAKRGRALRRHAVRAGDSIFVTGSLGGSALAVARAEREGRSIRTVPVPRLEAGRALAKLRGVGGCIDVSDGLVSDLEHLLEGSALGATVEVGRIPRPRGLSATAARLGLDPDAFVLAGGEDYELLFTLRARAVTRAAAGRLTDRLGVRVTEIGRITRTPGLAGLPDRTGWRHF